MFDKKIRNIYNTTKMQRLTAKFVTVDGEEHYTGNLYNWCKSEQLRCSAAEYIMIDIKDDGYILDEYGTMFVLNNVVSIKWTIEEELTVINKGHSYQIWFTYDELEKMGIVEG